MEKSRWKNLCAIACAVAVLAGVASARAERLLIVAADGAPPTQQLLGDPFDVVDVFDSRGGTPTLQQLQGYDVVLNYTNSTPQNQAGLGDVLADYVDGGGKVVLATYGHSCPWCLQGRIMTADYNPFTNPGNRDVSGRVNPVLPGDSVFHTPNSIEVVNITMFHNVNFAGPNLNPGAELLADDGAGVGLLAINADGNVAGANLFPATSPGGNNAEFYEFLENILVRVLSGGKKCQYTVSKAKGKGGCGNCPPQGGNYTSDTGCEDLDDCRKKVKTTIACPEGPGTCKIKAKRRACE